MPTKIEWAEESWNPITGCTKVSAGCEHCYARRMAQRQRGRNGYPADDPFRVTWQGDRMVPFGRRKVPLIDLPMYWKKPRMIFVCSMGDLFHENVPDEWIRRVMGMAWGAAWHTYLFLTKRPERLLEFSKKYLKVCCSAAFPPWFWFGVTAENQEAADERIPVLLKIPAAVRFVSVEPMLEPVALNLATPCDRNCNEYIYAEFPGTSGKCMMQRQLDWVICGGETGPGARRMELRWARSLRDQCEKAGVPFFFKKVGGKVKKIPDDLMVREWPRKAMDS